LQVISFRLQVISFRLEVVRFRVRTAVRGVVASCPIRTTGVWSCGMAGIEGVSFFLRHLN
jgi:hypothetical protein